MKVWLKMNPNGRFECFKGDEYIVTLFEGMPFRLNCERAENQLQGTISFSLHHGYIWTSEEQLILQPLCEGMTGVI